MEKANLNTFEKESQWTTKGFHWFIWIYIFPATLPGLCETSDNTQLLMVTELSRGALKNTLAHTQIMALSIPSLIASSDHSSITGPLC